MIYRIIFSILALLLLPILNYNLILAIIASGLLVAGTALSKDREWIPQLQGVTLVLFYALILFGFIRDRDTAVLSREVIIISSGYLFSGLYGFFLKRYLVSMLFSIAFWGMIATALSFAAYEKLGGNGILLSVVLIGLVAAQDIKKLTKLSFKQKKGDSK